MKAQKMIMTVLLVVAFLSLQTSSVVGKGEEQITEPSIQPITLYQAEESCDPEVKGKKIQESAAKLSETICGTSDIVSSDNTGFFSAKEKDFYAKQCDRTKGWVNAPGRDSTFASVGKKNEDSCYIVEIEGDDIGDDDGVCTQNEKIKGGCSEPIDDGIGDNDGVCEETRESFSGKGKKVKSWETCEEVCIIPEEEVQTDCSTLETMDGLLQDADTELSELNTQVSSQLQVLAEQRELYNEISVEDPIKDNCANVLLVNLDSDVGGPLGSYSGTGRAIEFNDFLWANTVAEITIGMANICTDTLGTDFFGSNALIACSALHVRQSVATGVLSSMELLDDNITSARLDNAATCIKQMDEKLNGIEKKLDEIIRLLNTPTGRRDSFPTK